MKKVMISCEEATDMKVKKHSEPLTFSDRLRLWMHLAICKLCALFAKQSQIIDDAAASLDESIPAKMPESARARILQELQK